MPHLPLYKVIGVMSGSSLDGVDIAYCTFIHENDNWRFTIDRADCFHYTKEWTDRLRSARSLDGRSLWKLHAEYGHLLGGMIGQFISQYNLTGKVDLISSHGHTIFHYPEEKFTTQIGDGAAIATITGLPVVCDLRSSDIALGGNGAPIVPIGDKLLFKEYNYLLNIGGIANITVKENGTIHAFDICAANQVLNYYASQKGLEYDKDGQSASSGKLHQPLLDALNELDYYKKAFPKSLDNGFSTDVVIPLINSFDISVQDKLHTYCEHIAFQVRAHIENADPSASSDARLLITGGGAFNQFLVSRISAISSLEVVVPSDTVVNYKEALVMAFIGVLRWSGEVNVLSSVTGASRDSVGGALYHP
ncbi:MAG: anhydro-N-acetylmuramic acid kinase [Bacteroidetes bacterium]|nr:anhydro-N-acetylmuramic acid kinase [Bacteroidota bacterium]